MNARILLIEENWENLELMRFLLKARGFEPLGAPHGKDAAAFAEVQLPDLILCELQMPDIDGYQILRAIRARKALAGVRVVALSTLAESGEVERVFAAGFQGHVAKPIAPESFVDEVARLLPGKSRSRNAGATGGTRAVKSILVVDDLRSNLELAEIVLQHLGYEVVLAQGRREALRALRAAKPDLIMSDARMDDGDGYELLQEVGGDPALEGIPFILITSVSVNEEERRRGLDLGADRYLVRPIAPHALRREIEACVRERTSA
jgi:two-component system cell cycle response regulator